MSGPFKRRPSLRKSSLRKPSLIPILLPLTEHKEEVPWDLVDRCFLPILFCHGASITLSSFLNGLGIVEVSAITLFFFLTIAVIGVVLIYHNLKVCSSRFDLPTPKTNYYFKKNKDDQLINKKGGCLKNQSSKLLSSFYKVH